MLAYEQEGSSFLNEASTFTIPNFVSDTTYDSADAQVASVLRDALASARHLLVRISFSDLAAARLRGGLQNEPVRGCSD